MLFLFCVFQNALIYFIKVYFLSLGILVVFSFFPSRPCKNAVLSNNSLFEKRIFLLFAFAAFCCRRCHMQKVLFYLSKSMVFTTCELRSCFFLRRLISMFPLCRDWRFQNHVFRVGQTTILESFNNCGSTIL